MGQAGRFVEEAVGCLGENILGHVAVDVGQAKISTGVAVGEFFVI